MRYLPLALSSLVLAAHFFRAGNFAFVAFVLIAPFLLLTKTRWSVIAVQAMLALAAAEWVRTAMAIARERAALGAPSTRMFVILGSVALFTLFSAIPLRRTVSTRAQV
jgi:hypothetical protein